MSELREHGGRRFAVQFHYSLPTDAWCVELSEAVPAPESWADRPDSPAYLSGPSFITAEVPDEDPKADPTIHVRSPEGYAVPYEVMLWFMEKVAEEVERCRTAMSAMGLEAATRPDGSLP